MLEFAETHQQTINEQLLISEERDQEITAGIHSALVKMKFYGSPSEVLKNSMEICKPVNNNEVALIAFYIGQLVNTSEGEELL